MEFEEQPGARYCASLFVELPPQKIVYVSVSETIKEEIEELMLN